MKENSKNLVHSSRTTVWSNPDGSAKTPVDGDHESCAFVPQIGDVMLTWDPATGRIYRQDVIRYSRTRLPDGSVVRTAYYGPEVMVSRSDAGVLQKAVDVLASKIRGEDVDFCDRETYFRYVSAINIGQHGERTANQSLRQASESQGISRLKP